MDDVHQIGGTIANLLHTVGQELTSVRLLTQFGLIFVSGVLGTAVAVLVRRRIDWAAITARLPAYTHKFIDLVLANLGTIFFVLIVTTVRGVMLAITWPSASYLVAVAGKLATAWVVIALVAGLIRNRFVYRVVAVSAWLIAALSIVDLFNPVVDALGSVGVVFGTLRVTPLLVIKTTVLLMFTLWVTNAIGDFLDRRLKASGDLTPSIQVLLSKVLRLLLVSFAVVAVLSTVGIDLSALAFFTGAVGVGVGLGLQKIVSNLVSGIILLADKSIKPGDVISVGEHFGRVGNMGARYTSVDTRDGREYLIPNEDFITQRVANWTYSSDLVRLFVKFNTTYDSDPHKTIEAAVETALSIDRVLRKPAPQCLLSAFGSSSIEYELWFWIRDPAAGVANVKSDVLLALWDSLSNAGVKIPKPGPSRVIYELAHEDEPEPPKDQSDAPPSPFPR